MEKLYVKTQTLLTQALYLPRAPGDVPDPSDGTSKPSDEIVLPDRSETANKHLQRLLKVPIPGSVLASLFSQNGILEGLGKVNLSESVFSLSHGLRLSSYALQNPWLRGWGKGRGGQVGGACRSFSQSQLRLIVHHTSECDSAPGDKPHIIDIRG